MNTKKDFLTIADFQGNGKTLNLSGFTNLSQINEGVEIKKALSDENFMKTGKQLKEKIVLLKSRIEGVLTQEKSDIAKLIEELPDKPTNDLDKWMWQNIPEEKRINDLKIYSYSKICPDNQTDMNFMKYRDYNRKIDKIVDCTVKLVGLELLERNLEEETQYKLNLQDLQNLAF